MELVSVFYVALLLCIIAIVCLDFFTWRQVSKLKKQQGGGFDEDRTTELFWELYTQAQVETPPPVVKEEQVQAMVLLALDRLGKLPVSEPKANGHHPDADEELAVLAHYDPRATVVIAEAKPVAAPVPEVPKAPPVTKVETANLMCKCGDGPFTDDEMKNHLASGMRKREKGKHGKIKEKTQ